MALAAPVRSIIAVAREFDHLAKTTTDITLSQYRFMLFLRNGPRQAGEIAATSLLTKATISGQINALRDKGWIETEIGEHDRRVSRVVLTPLGRAEMDRFEERLFERLEALIGDADKASILAALSDLYIALGQSREQRFRDLVPPEALVTSDEGA